MVSRQEQFEQVQAVKKSINTASEEVKNQALLAMADHLVAATEEILAANALDMAAAKGKISDVMLDRLYLDADRIEAMARGIREVVAFPDPIGEVLETSQLENGLVITKKRVAMGVIGIIYESRPNVTSDAAALTLKSGNAVVLRSGKDAYQTTHAIVTALKKGLETTTIHPNVIQLVEDTSHESSYAMMKAKGYLDLLIPRGGAGLINAVVENAIVPVIETGTGIVHVYVDKDADEDKAASILPRLDQMLVAERKEAGLEPIQFRLDSKASQFVSGQAAETQDFDTEFLDYVLAVKVVSSLEEAVAHIESHSTHHSDAIVTENAEAAAYFTDQVDSAAVYVNASTRFTDGGQFGLGCEMGISTQKLHARGPMGLKELTSYKYVVAGDGQIRE